MTFADIEFAFDDKCYVIKGENKDDAGQQSNGSGKSSFIDIIAVAVIGQSLSGRDLKNCVNRNGVDSFFLVGVTLDNDGHLTKISRKVYNNTRASELSITIDDKPIEGVPTKAGIPNGLDVKAGNQYILDTVLDISKEDLLNYFLISGDEYTSFFNAGQAKKIEIITRFSKAGVIDSIIDKLTKSQNQTTKDLQQIQTQITGLKGQIVGLEETISQVMIDRFEQDKATRISKALDEVESLSVALDKIEIKSIEQVDYESDLKIIVDEIQVVNKTIMSNAKSKTVAQQEISRLQVLLAGQIECPKCEHHFVIESELSIDDINEGIHGFESAIVDIDVILNEAQSQHGELLQMHRDLVEQRNAQVATIQANKLAQQRKVDIQQRLDGYEKVLMELDQMKFDDSNIKALIEQKNVLITENQILADNLVVSIADDNTWIDNFKQFKFYLSNKPVEVISHYTNEFLKSLGSELTIAIEGFRVLKSGELKAELTPIVYRNGLNPEQYAAFSGGEKVRLNIAVDLAFQRLVNENSKQGLSFYSNDEAINALDSVGVVSAAKAFNNLKETICLVSHSGSEMNYDNVITVTKKGHKSTI